jgi:hypothetical protein
MPAEDLLRRGHSLAASLNSSKTLIAQSRSGRQNGTDVYIGSRTKAVQRKCHRQMQLALQELVQPR